MFQPGPDIQNLVSLYKKDMILAVCTVGSARLVLSCQDIIQVLMNLHRFNGKRGLMSAREDLLFEEKVGCKVSF